MRRADYLKKKSNSAVIWQLCVYAPQEIEDATDCKGFARGQYVKVVRGNVLIRIKQKTLIFTFISSLKLFQC